MDDLLVPQTPAAALRPYVEGYDGYLELRREPVRRLEVPAPHVTLVVNFAGPLVLPDPHRPERPPELRSAFLAGLQDTYAMFEHPGFMAGVEARFTPLGARRFLGVPMDEVAGRTVGLEEVLGEPGRVLAARLEEAPDWPTRFVLLDEAIGARVREAPEPNRGVAWAWSRLRETHGRVAVGELGEELGWSPKRLIQRFREHVGLPPKTVARVLRFHRVVDLLLRAEGNRMGELAYAAGYYDQAHFNRDFRAFAGTTPSDFLSRRLVGGGFAG